MFGCGFFIPGLAVHGTVLSLDVTRGVDVQDISVEELAGLDWSAIGGWVCSRVVALLGTSGSTELGVESTLEDGASHKGVETK